jgi:hypothetical protein
MSRSNHQLQYAAILSSKYFPFFARNLVTLVVMWAFPGEVIWAKTIRRQASALIITARLRPRQAC